jgi:hypothetical protein
MEKAILRDVETSDPDSGTPGTPIAEVPPSLSKTQIVIG